MQHYIIILKAELSGSAFFLNYIIMLKYILFGCFAITLIACGGQKNVSKFDETTGATYYGEAFSAKNVMTVDDLFAKMADKEGMENISVEGEVISVCQVKGCWMRMAASNGDELMVKFKDYGFFMPLDLTGKVTMTGKAYKQVTPVDELRHYAEDAGKSAEEIAEITEPLEELLFEATGVAKL